MPFDAARRTTRCRVPADRAAPFPIGAGILFGLSVGGLFDAVVLHQILRWHQMLTSAAEPAGSIGNLHPTLLWEGVLQLASYACVAAGASIVWRAAQRGRACWSQRLLAATMLVGFGAFNIVEGAIAHLLLGLHHANETVPHEQWLGWDLGFVACGALMLVAGSALCRSVRSDAARQTTPTADAAARPAAWQRR